MANKAKVILCSFDVELREEVPRRKGLTANERDAETLKRADRISVFWITENQRRANLITRMEKSGALKLDNSCSYPWMKVVYVS